VQLPSFVLAYCAGAALAAALAWGPPFDPDRDGVPLAAVASAAAALLPHGQPLCRDCGGPDLRWARAPRPAERVGEGGRGLDGTGGVAAAASALGVRTAAVRAAEPRRRPAGLPRLGAWTAAKVEASTPRPNEVSSSPCSPLRAGPAPPAVQYRGYFERQVAGRRGMHALNNALGLAFAGEEDLVFACDEWLRASHHEGLPEVRARHMNAHGWYSIEVMSTCLNTTAMRVRGRIEYELCFEPLRVRPEILQVAVGALVNIDGRHWVALRFIDGVVWLLDSLDCAARPLEWGAYVNFVREQRNQNAFPIFTL